jgi:hypothetical protein
MGSSVPLRRSPLSDMPHTVARVASPAPGPALPPSGSSPARAWRLVAALLLLDGHLGEAESVLAALADSGDSLASHMLAGALARTGRLSSLRRRVRAGDSAAIRHLAAIAAERGWICELRALAATETHARRLLASALAARGEIDDALVLLRSLADAGDPVARTQLAPLLARHGRIDELRMRSAGGDWDCTLRLVDVLCASGRAAEAGAVLRAASMGGRT